MEPYNPSFVVEPDPEEPLEALDYYEAIQGGWLSPEADAEVEADQSTLRPPRE